jgi:hypothetical protein
MGKKQDDKINLGMTGDTLHVRVTPKAAANRIKIEAGEDGEPIIRIYVTTVPEDGKANKAVLKLLSKHLGIAPTSMVITHGVTGRDKTIRVMRD